MKTELKKMVQVKSYGKNKIFDEKRAKKGLFPMYFDPKIKMGGPRLRMVGKL